MDIEETKNHLEHLTEYAISYFRHLLEKYGEGRERKTEIRNFEDIQAVTVAVANEKLYVNRATGFAGYALKKDEEAEYVFDCSKMDDIIVFRKDGTMMVTKVQEKGFIGSTDCKEIEFVGLFRKGDERTVYNMIYRDGAFGYVYVKRFSVLGITRDKEYDLTKGTKGSKILYFTANPNGEAETVTIHHVSKPKIKKTSFDFNFATLAIKGRSSMGNILTRNPVRNINMKGEGVSTLGARKIWFDESVKRLNVNEAGVLLGEFKGRDRILTIMQSGYFRTTNFDLGNHFDDDMVLIRKYNPHTIISVVYKAADTGSYYLKRFTIEDHDKKYSFLEENSGDTMVTYAVDTFPRLEVLYDENSNKKIDSEIIEVSDFIAVKGFRAKGKRITTSTVKEFRWLEPLPEPEPEPEPEDDTDNMVSGMNEIDEREGFAEGTQTTLF